MLEDGGPDRGPQPLRHRQHAGRPPLEPGAQGQRDVQAGHRLHREGREGRHHRRVHRPDDGRAALVGRASPGGRGQGRRRDRAREPDARLDHLPELFPHVSEAVGHDRHGADRGAGILRHLPDERRVDPDQRRRSSGSTRTTNSTRTSPTSSRAIAKEISERQEKGQPVLVGTVSIEKSEMLSEFLEQEGIKHSVLNARFHESEAHIVAQAGPHGRGDHRHQHGRPRHRHSARRQHRLPHRGRARRHRQKARSAIAAIERIRAEIGEEKQRVLDAGGLFVLGTERHESRRIDNQLRGRSGRQGDPGLSRFYLSLDDDLLRIFGPQTDVRAADEQEPRGRRGDRQPVDLARRSRPRRRRSRRATTTSASRSSNSTT